MPTLCEGNCIFRAARSGRRPGAKKLSTFRSAFKTFSRPGADSARPFENQLKSTGRGDPRRRPGRPEVTPGAPRARPGSLSGSFPNGENLLRLPYILPGIVDRAFRGSPRGEKVVNFSPRGRPRARPDRAPGRGQRQSLSKPMKKHRPRGSTAATRAPRSRSFFEKFLTFLCPPRPPPPPLDPPFGCLGRSCSVAAARGPPGPCAAWVGG